MAFDEEQLTEEESARRHRWRRIRTSVTLLVLIGVVIGAAWYSWDNVVSEDDSATAGARGGHQGAPSPRYRARHRGMTCGTGPPD